MQAEVVNADSPKPHSSSPGINSKGKGQATIANPKQPGEKDVRVKKESAVFNLHTSGSTKAK
mgnify:FL=1